MTYLIEFFNPLKIGAYKILHPSYLQDLVVFQSPKNRGL